VDSRPRCPTGQPQQWRSLNPNVSWAAEAVPFGIATWCTTGAIRDLRIRKLELDELREDAGE